MSMAVLDLGTNSFTMLVARVLADGSLGQVARDREAVAIGDCITPDNRIDQDGWRRAMVAMAGLVGQARMHGATQVLAVATGAIRDAENGVDLLAAASRELGVEIAVLAPNVAARLAYLGARSELPSLFGQLAVIDLGGGSIEIAVGENDASLFDCSLPFGVRRVKAMLDDEQSPVVFEAVRAALAPAARAVRGFQPERVVFASGTARAVHKLVRKRSTVGVGYSYMDRAALKRVAEWVSDASPEALREAGVREDRLVTIGLATQLLDLIADMLQVPELWLSRRGLREGVLFEQLRDGHSFHGPAVAELPQADLPEPRR